MDQKLIDLSILTVAVADSFAREANSFGWTGEWKKNKHERSDV